MPRRGICGTFAILLIAHAGCFSKASRETLMVGHEATGVKEQVPSGSLSGRWEGTSVATCEIFTIQTNRCNATQAIQMTFIQQGSKIEGHYRCSYGNENCLDLNETGKIAFGSFDAGLLSLRIAMPDGSSCLFNGTQQKSEARGGYACYQGGALLEQGRWRLHRSY